MRAGVALSRSYLLEYARRPLNLVLLLVVPIVFVVLASQPIADFAELLGGASVAAEQASLTAGWAAAFLAGVAGFFHVLGSRTVDRRLAHAGMGPIKVAGARLVSGLLLAFLAAGGALLALEIRVGVPDPGRTIAATLMFALIYLNLGVAIGSVVRSEINGSLVIVLVWIVDVFLGPGMAGSQEVWITRLFPTHFPTLVAMDAATGHAGPLSDAAAAAAWTVGTLVVAFLLFVWRARPAAIRPTAVHSAASRPAEAPPGAGASPPRAGTLQRTWGGLRFAMKDNRRNVVQWVLLLLLPVLFITLSFAVTPDTPTPIEVREAGAAVLLEVSMIDLHGAIMVPITVSFLAGLAGMFVVQASADADRRLALSGFKTWEILTARFGVILAAAGLISLVSLAVTALDFQPVAWLPFAGSTLLVAVQYGLVGVLVGTIFGRLGGLYIMFLLSFLDSGLAQNTMFAASAPEWGTFFPAHGPVKVLIDGAFTGSFDEVAGLALGLGWVAALGIGAGLVFHRLTRGATG